MTDSTAGGEATPSGVLAASEQRHDWPPTTRRGVQVALGVLWLVDGVLQLQPFMFTTGFARQVLAPAGQGQVAWVARWFPAAWALLWVGGAVLQLLPAQRGTAALRDQLGSTQGLPGWLAGLHDSAGSALSHGGNAPFIALVAVMAVVGLAGLAGRPWRTAVAVAGAMVAVAFWVMGENIGQLYSGQATDPNTGPLIVLMALALAGTTTRTRRAPKP